MALLILQPLHSFPTRRSSDLYPTASQVTMSSFEMSLRMCMTPLASFRVSTSAKNGEMIGTVAPDHLSVLRSEEHTSELQSRLHLVCRLLLEKKKCDTENAISY